MESQKVLRISYFEVKETFMSEHETNKNLFYSFLQKWERWKGALMHICLHIAFLLD